MTALGRGNLPQRIRAALGQERSMGASRKPHPGEPTLPITTGTCKTQTLERIHSGKLQPSTDQQTHR
jgi:hypothetical protein